MATNTNNDGKTADSIKCNAPLDGSDNMIRLSNVETSENNANGNPAENVTLPLDSAASVVRLDGMNNNKRAALSALFSKMMAPTGVMVAPAAAPKIALPPGAQAAGWTLGTDGVPVPPGGVRGGAMFETAASKAAKAAKVAEKKAGRKAKLDATRVAKIQRLVEEKCACLVADGVEIGPAERAEILTSAKSEAAPGRKAKAKEDGPAVVFFCYYASGLVKQEEAETLEDAGRAASLFLQESEGEGLILRVKIIMSDEDTPDQVVTRNELIAINGIDGEVFDWATYCGRQPLGAESWTPGQRVAEYLKGNKRKRPNSVCEPARQGNKLMRCKPSRAVFPKHSPSAYVGDWRSVKSGRYGQ